MFPKAKPQSEEALLAEVEPVIQRAVCHKLRVSLRASDGSERNLDALDLLGEIRLRLIKKLRALAEDETSPAVNELSAYAATVAYNCCSDYLRAKYPERTSLRNCLRRLLEKADGYAVWPNENGELLCGYVGWRASSRRANASAVQSLQQDRSPLPANALPKISHWNTSVPEWLRLLEAIFNHLDAPLELDDLIVIVSPIVGVEDVVEVSPTAETEGAPESELPPPQHASPYAERLMRERLTLFWGALLQLLPWHRVAYLLNVRDWDPMCLPLYGVATVEEIGRSLELKPNQFEILAQALAGTMSPPRVKGDTGAIFAQFWDKLPLDDNVIAKVLGVTRPQVIGYRNKAKERLARSLRALL